MTVSAIARAQHSSRVRSVCHEDSSVILIRWCARGKRDASLSTRRPVRTHVGRFIVASAGHRQTSSRRKKRWHCAHRRLIRRSGFADWVGQTGLETRRRSTDREAPSLGLALGFLRGRWQVRLVPQTVVFEPGGAEVAAAALWRADKQRARFRKHKRVSRIEAHRAALAARSLVGTYQMQPFACLAPPTSGSNRKA